MPPKSEGTLGRKALHEALTTMLAGCDAPVLRDAIHRLADEWRPDARPTLLRIAREALEPEPATPATDALQTTIDRLCADVEARLATIDEWPPDPDLDDNDAALDDLLPACLDAFGRAARTLEQGDAARAREAYARLFALLASEDDYGRGFGPEAFDSTELHEHAARYLRSVYLKAAPDHRPQAVVRAARALHELGLRPAPGPAPGIEALEQAAPGALPEWDRFLDGLASTLEEADDALGDAWLREAVTRRQGIDGLAALAERQGTRRPRAWVDRVRMAADAGRDEDALAGWHDAQAVFPRHAPVQAELAEAAAEAAERTGDTHALERMHLEACLADPAAVRLAAIVEAAPDADEAIRRLRAAAEALERHRKAPQAEARGRERTPPLSRPIAPGGVSPAVVALACLMAGDRDAARALADDARALGWSSDHNPQPVVVGYTLMAVAGADPRRLRPNGERLWRAALGRVAIGAPALARLERFGDAFDRAQERIDEAVRRSLIHTPLPDAEKPAALEWCTNIVWRRATAIVERKHRGAYERAATAVAACVEAAAVTAHEAVTRPMVERLRGDFPRHSAFQRALRTALPGAAP